MKALVVLSGGQDSATCLAIAVAQHGADNVAALSFNYGQRHMIELCAARDLCTLLNVENHEICATGTILKGTSPLTNHEEPLERYEDFKTMEKIIGDRVEKTFVPMRNALFLTLAANRAVCMGASEIWTGVCEADNANYPDCRETFIHHQERAINEALGNNEKNWMAIVAPLMFKSKSESIAMMIASGCYPLLAFTHTAYDGKYPPTSLDHASLLRAQGFIEANVPDPLVVRAWTEGAMTIPATSNYHMSENFVLTLITSISKFKEVLGQANQPFGKAVP